MTPKKVIAHDLRRRGEVHTSSWSPCFSGSVAKSSSSLFVVSFFLSPLSFFFFLSFYVPLSSSSTTVFSPRRAPLMRFRASYMCVCVCIEGHRHAGFSNTVISGSTSRFIRWFVIIEITVSRIRYSCHTYFDDRLIFNLSLYRWAKFIQYANKIDSL